MKLARKGLIYMGFLALLTLAACSTDTREPVTIFKPDERGEPKEVTPKPPSAESEKLAVYYRRLQNDLTAQGLLRGDGGGPDTAFTDTILARNFVRIALFDEYISDGDFVRPQATLSKLRRWDQPVRMKVEFGASVPHQQRIKDRKNVKNYADRLSRITGQFIDVADFGANFNILIVNEDDRRDIGGRIRDLVPGISTGSLNAMLNLPRDQLCIVVAFSDGVRDSYSRAIAIIRAEHPDLLRLSCIHEELAQGLGLANDSPQARPSIFNDDEEFGLLTTHDELLLKILYDPRLQAGMSPAEAAPIARVIAREIMASGPS